MFLFTNECTLYNYADENSLSCATAVQEVISSLQFDGSRVIQWFTDSGMQANPSKFQFMIIYPMMIVLKDSYSMEIPFFYQKNTLKSWG